LNLHWVPNPGGPTPANGAGGVWHLTAYARPQNDTAPSLTPMPFLDLQVGVPPATMEADRLDGGTWRTLPLAQPWLRDIAVQALREPTLEERAMSKSIAAQERRDQDRFAATGQRPVRAAND
jgi:hypothetical protein